MRPDRPWASLTRRDFITAAGAAGAAGAITVAAPDSAAWASRGHAVVDRRPGMPRLGSGGRPTTNRTIARLARDHANGEPAIFVDLAAVDQNTKLIVDFANANNWAVRPALKAFQCPRLCAYILARLPKPRGLVFHLRTVDQIMSAAPGGTDLLMGYPPTRGELRAYLAAPPPTRRPHRLTLLASSTEMIEEMGMLARSTRRRLPLDVGLEFDSGEGRGGFIHTADITAAIKLLRRYRDRLRLRAIVCYDGHATATPDETWRKFVAKQARGNYARYLDQLHAEGADLYDRGTLIRNGPASANYHNWAGTSEINEISPGSAFVYAGYLAAGFDDHGLAPAITQAAPC